MYWCKLFGINWAADELKVTMISLKQFLKNFKNDSCLNSCQRTYLFIFCRHGEENVTCFLF
jgi:hypothetical protein